MLIAVETGDIVRSTQLTRDELNEVFSYIRSELNDENTSLPSNKHSHLEVFRGDSYQITFFDPQSALRIALLIKLRLKFGTGSFALTQSLAIGELEDKASTPNINMSEVYVRSGRNLDFADSGELHIDKSFANDDFSLFSECINQFFEQLTQKQAKTLYYYIKQAFPEHKIIAKQLSVSRQNVNTHLQRAHANLFRKFLERYKSHISKRV